MKGGTVKSFDLQKELGLIRADCYWCDVFVHIIAVKLSGMNRLSEWRKIYYELMNVSRGGKSSGEKLEIIWTCVKALDLKDYMGYYAHCSTEKDIQDGGFRFKRWGYSVFSAIWKT